MDESFRIPSALDGERLDRALAILTGLSRRDVNVVIDAGEVTVGRGVVTSRSRAVREGERVRLGARPPSRVPGRPVAEPGVEVPVVWNDDAVIVVDKPAGLVVHAGAGNSSGTMVHGLVARFPEIAGVGPEDRPGIVHRLDKGTSGLLVVARNLAAFESLSAQMAARSVGRVYVCLVAGDVESDGGVVDAPLGRSHIDPTRVRVQAGGRPARTRYEVMSRQRGPAPSTLIRCRLETGRTHQIRVHLASIGHPVVGDERYGTRRLGGWTPLPAGRQFLHAAELAFDHPGDGRRLSFESPLPPDLAAVLTRIEQTAGA